MSSAPTKHDHSTQKLQKKFKERGYKEPLLKEQLTPRTNTNATTTNTKDLLSS